MFNNIEIMEINKKEVMMSITITFTAVFALIFIAILWDSLFISDHLDIGGVFASIFLFIIFGFPVWLPIIIICLMLEYILIFEKSTKKSVGRLLFAEGIIATLIMCLVFGFELIVMSISFLLFEISIFIRWRYLLSKDRLFNIIHS